MTVRKIVNHGKVVWMARARYRGLRRASFRPTREAARAAEAQLLQAMQAEVAETTATGDRPATLRLAFAWYLVDLENRGKGRDTVGRAEETRAALQRLLPALLDRPVSRVLEADLFAFRAARTEAGAKPSTINRDLRTLRALLKRVVPGYRFPPAVFLPEDETRVRWLEPDQELLLEAALRPPFRQIARLAMLTLMRLTEVRTLRRDMVHLGQGVILLPRAKGGPRPVVLSQEAQALLRTQLAAQDESYVFPGPLGRPYERNYGGRVFRRAAQSIGLRDFHFHDLRHHGATVALNRGFSGPIVQALGGWKTPRMMQRYAAVTDATLRAAAEAVSGQGSRPLGSKGGQQRRKSSPRKRRA